MGILPATACGSRWSQSSRARRAAGRPGGRSIGWDIRTFRGDGVNRSCGAYKGGACWSPSRWPSRLPAVGRHVARPATGCHVARPATAVTSPGLPPAATSPSRRSQRRPAAGVTSPTRGQGSSCSDIWVSLICRPRLRGPLEFGSDFGPQILQAGSKREILRPDLRPVVRVALSHPRVAKIILAS